MSVPAAAAQIRQWRRYPAQMVWDLFSARPEVYQHELLEAWASASPEHQRISMQACAGPGKTAAIAWCAWNFLLCYGDTREHPKGAAVAVTGDNLRDNLWAELSKWQQQSPLLLALFTWTKQRIFAKDHPQTWWLSARSYPKTASPEEQGRTLSGLHSQFIAYFIDESGDISPAILRAAEQGIGGTAFGKIVQAGNPTSHAGMLYAAANQLRHQWHLIRITGDPDDPRRATRIDRAWAAEQIATYGRDNPWVMAYILGQFPPGGLNTLLGPDDMNAALGRHLGADVYSWAPRLLGVDVARFGDDRTVIFPRQGRAAFRPVVLRGASTTQVAARVAQAATKWGAHGIFVDDTGGHGSGVIDQLGDAGFPVFGVNSSGAARNPRYFNTRSEVHFLGAEWVKSGGALPRLPELSREACAATYFFDKGRLRVVEKDQIKALLGGQSPDLWDAFLLTFALDVAAPDPRELILPGAGAETPAALADFDPYAGL